MYKYYTLAQTVRMSTSIRRRRRLRGAQKAVRKTELVGMTRFDLYVENLLRQKMRKHEKRMRDEFLAMLYGD